MELTINVCFVFKINASMELVNVCSSALGVENIALHDVKSKYYCLGLVDHSEVNPLHVFTSPCGENEGQLIGVSCANTLNEVGSL